MRSQLLRSGFISVALAILALGATGCSYKPVFGDLQMRSKSSCACDWRVETHEDAGYAQFIRFDDDTPTTIDAVATVQIQTFASHAAANKRLIGIANESLEPATWLKSYSWPTLMRKYEAPVGGLNLRRMGAIEGNVPAMTWAQASDKRVIRVEARARVKGSKALDNLTAFMGTMALMDSPSPQPAVLEQELRELEATAKRTRPVMR